MYHFVSSIKESQDGLSVVDAGQEDHQTDVQRHHVQVQLRRVEVVRQIKRDLGGGDKMIMGMPILEMWTNFLLDRHLGWSTTRRRDLCNRAGRRRCNSKATVT